MERREKARAEREWDRDKVRDFGKPGEEKEGDPQRSLSKEKRRKERAEGKEKKSEKKGERRDYLLHYVKKDFCLTEAVIRPLTENESLIIFDND